MKHLLIWLMIINYNLLADQKNNLDQYNEMFEKVGKQRAGLNDKQINEVENPFSQIISIKISKDKSIKKEEEEEETLDLQAIVANRAKINQKWYKKGEDIFEYKIIKILSNNVELVSNQNLKKTKKLNITKDNSNVSIK